MKDFYFDYKYKYWKLNQLRCGHRRRRCQFLRAFSSAKCSFDQLEPLHRHPSPPACNSLAQGQLSPAWPAMPRTAAADDAWKTSVRCSVDRAVLVPVRIIVRIAGLLIFPLLLCHWAAASAVCQVVKYGSTLAVI